MCKNADTSQKHRKRDGPSYCDIRERSEQRHLPKLKHHERERKAQSRKGEYTGFLYRKALGNPKEELFKIGLGVNNPDNRKKA